MLFGQFTALQVETDKRFTEFDSRLRTAADEALVHRNEQRITMLERAADKQSGMWAGGRYALWLVSLLPPAIGAYVLAKIGGS